MSVVVPAYNEESRIKAMLAEAVHYLDKTYLGNSEWEILIVDDGSADDTSNVALDWAAEYQEAGAFDDGQVRICRLEKNRGKGGAVSHVSIQNLCWSWQEGMQHVRGEYVIFADADGASKFDDLGKLEEELKLIERDGLGVAVGSRAHMVHSAAVVQACPQMPRVYC
jgi:dolichyl-phosphate beta-glucosyltransferase